jgi:hypothetical protein
VNLITFIDRHARTIIAVPLALALAGAAAALSLPVGLFPAVSLPVPSKKLSEPFPAFARFAPKRPAARRKSPSTSAGAAT